MEIYFFIVMTTQKRYMCVFVLDLYLIKINCLW
jgi:hypothetical protein